jgi:hypothetical protein
VGRFFYVAKNTFSASATNEKPSSPRRFARGFCPFYSRSSPDLASNFTHLLCQVLFNYLVPNPTALAILMRAFLKVGQLRSPLANQRVQPEQLGLKFGDLTFFAFHHYYKLGNNSLGGPACHSSLTLTSGSG